jgi:murein DD-endopeptidase MepM/ murein hydrolase activator NlpD
MNQSFSLILALVILITGCSHTEPVRKPANENDYQSWAPADELEIDEESPATDTGSSFLAEDEAVEKFKNQNKSYFDWPVDLARLTRGFNKKKRRPHLGLDLAANKGTRIFASHNGRIVYTGKAFKGFGKLIVIEGEGGWATLYAHLSEILVNEGDVVEQGQMIGKMGRTGRATGVHLHFEIRRQRLPIDPLPYLPGGEQIMQSLANKK